MTTSECRLDRLWLGVYLAYASSSADGPTCVFLAASQGHMSLREQNIVNMHTRKDVFPTGPSREDGQGLRKVVYKVGTCKGMPLALRRCADHDIRSY